METGYDILFFWVARMIMMGLENTGDIPFSTVYLHGLIRDDKGEKMSKVKGNVINPISAIEEFGADALRFAVTTGSAPGNDIRVSSQKLEASRNFANKLWNAARFVMRNLSTSSVDMEFQPLHVQDRWIISRLDRLVLKVNQLLEDFQFGEAERQIHDFLWGEFCDWYIELAKNRLQQQESLSPVPFLVKTLEISLRLLHPFMPFITEEIWQRLTSYLPYNGARTDSLMIAPYPTTEGFNDIQAEEEMQLVIEIIRSIRNARAESKIDPARWIEGHIYTENPAIESHCKAIEVSARIRPLTIMDPRKETRNRDGAVVLVLRGAEVVLPMSDVVDFNAEKQRLEKEKDACQTKITQLRIRLNDSSFLSKAPANVVEKERGKLLESQSRLKKLEERLSQLSK
jgi:valyl-tRNA synthetase